MSKATRSKKGKEKAVSNDTHPQAESPSLLGMQSNPDKMLRRKERERRKKEEMAGASKERERRRKEEMAGPSNERERRRKEETGPSNSKPPVSPPVFSAPQSSPNHQYTPTQSRNISRNNFNDQQVLTNFRVHSDRSQPQSIPFSNPPHLNFNEPDVQEKLANYLHRQLEVLRRYQETVWHPSVPRPHVDEMDIDPDSPDKGMTMQQRFEKANMINTLTRIEAENLILVGNSAELKNKIKRLNQIAGGLKEERLGLEQKIKSLMDEKKQWTEFRGDITKIMGHFAPFLAALTTRFPINPIEDQNYRLWLAFFNC